MQSVAPQKKYLKIADIVLGLKDKKVLEVGGCSSPELLRDYKPELWTCVDLNEKAVLDFNQMIIPLGIQQHSAKYLDVNELDANEAYDIVYSINAFEHIYDVEKAMAKIYNALKPGGYLFTLFGPIWSSDVGHHLSIPTDDGQSLNFAEGILAPWEHLTATREALLSKLVERYGSKTGERAVNYIYEHPDLNRMFEHDYLTIVKNSAFSEVLIVKNKKGKAPKVSGASNTRELFMLLKKGHVGILESPVALLKFLLAYLTSLV
jgi:SAM-dependent methyltransferase